jgi:hypothetical protein
MPVAVLAAGERANRGKQLVRLSMSRLFDGLAIGIFDGLPATGSRVL